MINNESKEYLKKFEEESFDNFMVANYNFYENELYLKPEDYNNLLDYICSGKSISGDFIRAEKEVQEYCLKYGIFDQEGVMMVASLINERKNLSETNLSISEILTKYKQLNLEEKIAYDNDNNIGNFIKTFIYLYSNNDKRLIQMLNFVDMHLLFYCSNILVINDSKHNSLEKEKSLLIAGDRLLKYILDELREEVNKLLLVKEYDKLIELLQNKKSKDSNESIINESENFKTNEYKKIDLVWLDNVKFIINNAKNSVVVLALLYELYFCYPNTTDLDCFDAVYPALENYSQKILGKFYE